MKLTEQIAKLFEDVYYGPNWTGVNLKETLKDVTWQQATAKVHSLNTIAALVFHLNYYVSAVLRVLEGKPIDASDKHSFDCPPISSDNEWQILLTRTWDDAHRFARMVIQTPEYRLWETFVNEKYGNYYRNFHGVIEHCHYHLGQIVVIKKLLAEKDPVQ